VSSSVVRSVELELVVAVKFLVARTKEQRTFTTFNFAVLRHLYLFVHSKAQAA